MTLIKNTIIILMIGNIFCSCNSNKSENNVSLDVAVNNAFIKLEEYNYQDHNSYGGCNDNRTLLIKGITNFPDHTNIKIDIDGFVPSTKKENSIDTHGNVIVESGKFEIELKPWNVPQGVTFRVFRNDQSEKMLKIFGQNGENIKIDKVNTPKFPGICFYENSTNINEELINKLKGLDSPKYIFQTAKDFNHPSEIALANFVYEWKNENWQGMLNYVQKSQQESKQYMEHIFGNNKIVGFEILDKKLNPEYFDKEWFSIRYRVKIIPMISHKGIQTRIITANVINEDGQWGVNTTSALNGLFD